MFTQQIESNVLNATLSASKSTAKLKAKLKFTYIAKNKSTSKAKEKIKLEPKSIASEPILNLCEVDELEKMETGKNRPL